MIEHISSTGGKREIEREMCVIILPARFLRGEQFEINFKIEVFQYFLGGKKCTHSPSIISMPSESFSTK